MRNLDVYLKNPLTQKLVNEGVANVNDDRTALAMQVLRYELETFVCDGQYEKGLAHVLETYLKNIDEAQQPAVWISGFFGSGKSHFVKMLRALWEDTRFEDGATARGIVRLPQSIGDLLKELSTQGKRHGGLFALSGTLGSRASDKSVRLALLEIVLKAAGLPGNYPRAHFVLWLRQNGIEEKVKSYVEDLGGVPWHEELAHFYVGDRLHEALARAKPELFPTPASCVQTLTSLFPPVQDISSEEMRDTLRRALSRDGKFPLTVIILDEVQQYIGYGTQQSQERSLGVQETVEACCKEIGGKLLFIGTGQTAVTAENLKRLEGRFTVRIELSDADVDSVVRQVVLAKKPEAKAPLEEIAQDHLGEISRHLQGSTIGHKEADVPYFPQDYPILPVRRRFWETALRVLDPTGTNSQLRNQLSMVHKAIQSNAEAPVGTTVPADYLYFDAAEKLLQSFILPRTIYEKTMKWQRGGEEERLMARICGLVFLVNKVSALNKEIGVRATVDTLADLLLEDLTQGSASLRARLPEILEKCEKAGHLMKVKDEYHNQTEESTAWNNEFLHHQGRFHSETALIDGERYARIKAKTAEIVRRLSVMHGASRVAREVRPHFDAGSPKDVGAHLYICVREGYDVDRVRREAFDAGKDSPLIFLFLPQQDADELRNNLIDLKAAQATMDTKGVPGSTEGKEARDAMETKRFNAERRVEELLDACFAKARVFQAGGNEVLGDAPSKMLEEAAQNALVRLYPSFCEADHLKWHKVFERAREGALDALKAVEYDGKSESHSVCRALLNAMVGGKKGAEIRSAFEAPPYGWPRDAIDGGLAVLLVCGLIRGQNEQGKAVEGHALDRSAMGKTLFRVESATVSALQRTQIRSLLQQADISVREDELHQGVEQYLEKMQNLAAAAGGERPKPALPPTTLLDEIRQSAGNEQLLALYNGRDELEKNRREWQETKKRIEARWPAWKTLLRLAAHGDGLPDAEVFLARIRTLEEQRLLLDDPDPVAPLEASLSDLLRGQLNTLAQDYQEAHRAGVKQLEQDRSWQQLEREQRHEILKKHLLTKSDEPPIQVETTAHILATLDTTSQGNMRDRIAALPGRFHQALRDAAHLLEPKTQIVPMRGGPFQNEAEIDAWLQDVRKQLREALSRGPVLIQ